MSDDARAWPADWSALYDMTDLDRRPLRDFYRSLAADRTHSLLDLGCGTGSVTLDIITPLPPGARVVGVDLSPKMIEIARSRAPDLEWLVGDLCAPPVTGPFDLITVCFHTLQMLLDDAQLAQAFRSAAGLLAPGGRFAFDIYQPNLDWLARLDPTPVVVRRVRDDQGRWLEVRDGGATYDPVTRVLSSQWTLHDGETGQLLPLAPLPLRVRQYFPDEVAAHLAAAGLRIAERYGDFDRRAFGPGTIRQILVCERA